jgi:hypothetical protein
MADARHANVRRLTKTAQPLAPRRAVIGPIARWTVIGLVSAFLLAACGGSSHRPERLSYELHMDFFSQGLPSVIDPQVFVRAAGSAAGTGPQGISHAKGLAPAHKSLAANTPLFNAVGAPLHLTLGEWRAARGSVVLSCVSGRETAVSQATGLVPDGLYSVFIVHLHLQGAARFTPFGGAGGTNNSGTASPTGSLKLTDTVTPCLTSAEAVLIVWHSDHASHAGSLGMIGVTSHNSLIVPVDASTHAH